MERLQKWFEGGDVKTSEPKNVGESNITIVKKEQTTAGSVQTPSERPNVNMEKVPKEGRPTTNTMPQQVGSGQPEFESKSSDSVTETRVGQLMSQGRQMILRVVPLKEGDCLSCKLIGSGAMWGAAVFVLLSYPKAKVRYTGFRRKVLALQVGTFASTLTLLGVVRFFDLSIFSPPDADGHKKSFGELVAEDLDNAYKYTSQLFSGGSASDSKKDS